MIALFYWVSLLCDSTLEKINAFLDDFEDYAANDSSANQMEKALARKEVGNAIRTFVNSSVCYNPFVTEVVKQEMGLSVLDMISTPQPHPIIVSNVMEVTIPLPAPCACTEPRKRQVGKSS